MTRNREVSHMHYYTAGNAARQLEQKPEKQAVRKTLVSTRTRRIPVPFDPVAVFGTAVALVMLVCMVVGLTQVNSANDQVRQMQSHISALKAEQEVLQERYAQSYDLESIRAAAEEMGLVPVEEVRHITVTLPKEEAVEELTWWQQTLQALQELFA